MSRATAIADTPLLRRLRQVVGDDGVLTDPDQLLVYESDGLTQYRHPPSAVVLPRETAELQRVVGILHDEGRPFVPRGSGTGLSGGALALEGAVAVSTTRMNRILELDPGNRRARVQPGVVNAHLSRAAAPHGLYYAPDPSSQSACTLGGNVAENSGGPHCLKYGVTTRYVTGLSVVLPSGELVELGGAGRDAGELDLVGLFVGSEGCFGIAAEIEVALLPLPEAVRTLLGLFDDLETAGEAVSAIMARGLLPAALEIVDRETIRAVEASAFAAGYPEDVGAALVVEFDGVADGLEREVEEARAACLEGGAREVRTAADDDERAALWQGRKKAFGAMGRIAPDLMVQDATVPRTRLPEVLGRIGEIGERYGLRVANVFHAGDGNLHPNLLFDRRNADELARVEKASREIMEVCIQAGGTITGEHGVGLDKRAYMPLVCSEAVLETMGQVKEAFDPGGLCNPGKVLPDGFGPGSGSGVRTGAGDVDPVATGGDGAEGSAPRRTRGKTDHSGASEGRGEPTRDQVRDRVEALLGAEALVDVQELAGGNEVTAWNAGFGAAEDGGAWPVRAAPGSPEETAALMRVAVEQGWRVQPAGSGVGLDVGLGGGRASGGGRVAEGDRLPRPAGPPLSPHLQVSTRRMSGVLEYEPGDLTLRVGAGITLAQVERTVAAEGQWLPLDPPGGGAVSVGGVVASGTAGPLRAAFGRPRDQVLGLTLVDGRSRVLGLGGRVVKNVAGFDLVRLVAGSGGALGTIHEVVLRLFPRPEVDRTLVWNEPDAVEGAELGRRLARLPFVLTSLELSRGVPVAAHGEVPDGAAVTLRLTGAEEVVRRLGREAAERAGEPDEVLEGDRSRSAARVRSVCEGRGAPHVRIQVLPARVPELMERLAADVPGSVAPPTMAVHLGSGGVRLWHDGGPDARATGAGAAAATDALGWMRAVRETVTELGGTLRVTRWVAPGGAPGAAPGVARGPGEDGGDDETWWEGSAAFTASASVAGLHRKLRRTFDPGGVLPGAWREGWR